MTPWKDRQEGDGWTMYLGDCREILPTLGKVDAVVTDPPYGIEHESNHVCDSTTAHWMNSQIAGDMDTALRDHVIEWTGGRPLACFGSHKATMPFGCRAVLIWDKGPASGMGDLSVPWKQSWEFVFVLGPGWNGPRDEGVLKGMHIVTRASMGRVHPHEKPVPLLRHIVSKVSGTILDPFAGSGTTGVACIETGRRFVGVEIDPDYFRVACNRLRSATPCLFGRDG